MTDKKIAELMAKSDERSEKFYRIYRLLDKMAEEIDGLRFDALEDFSFRFTGDDEHASQFWSDMETAREGIYGAMDELRSLGARETLRYGKLCDIQRRQNGEEGEANYGATSMHNSCDGE